MATYPVVNTKTGEQKEVMMSIMEWDQWCADNPDWSRDYSDPSTMPGVGEVGEWKDKLRKSKRRNQRAHVETIDRRKWEKFQETDTGREKERWWDEPYKCAMSPDALAMLAA